MTHHKDKTVGVIGGLGPEATLDFYSKLIRKTQATNDQDHLQVIINSNPKVPNRQEALLGNGPSCAPSLIHSAKALEKAGADFLVMVCNTAHAYEHHIRSAVNLPFISIIKESVEACMNQMPVARRVGLLAADGCLAANLYQAEFMQKDIDCITPTAADQAELMELIFNIKANQHNASTSLRMAGVAQNLINSGADVVLAACTEVPLVLKPDTLAAPLISSTDALVDSVLNFAKMPHELFESHWFYSQNDRLRRQPFIHSSAMINA